MIVGKTDRSDQAKPTPMALLSTIHPSNTHRHTNPHPPIPNPPLTQTTHTQYYYYTAYLRYAAQIRQEYAHVPRPTYLTARANVLTSFLDRERIFASGYYHARLEAAARENVKAEVALLQGGVIPGEGEKR